MNNQTQSAAELFEARQRRIIDAIELREPDRVPVSLYAVFWIARNSGMTCRQAMYDYEGISSASRRAIIDLEPDGYMNIMPAVCLGPTMDLLDYKQLQWPGRNGLDEDVSFQYLDKEYMAATEYSDYLKDPTGFYLRKYLPRIAGNLEPLANLPDYPGLYYTGLIQSIRAFACPDIKSALETLIKAGEELEEMGRISASFDKEIQELGFPSLAAAKSAAPFDVVVDYMRGSRAGMLDLFKNKDVLLESIDKLSEYLPRSAIQAAQSTSGKLKIVFIPLHWGLDGFMSPEQFETLYWPSLRKVTLKLIDAGLTPCLFWEGDVTSRLDIIKDIPRGKCIYMFERTDLFKAKEVLGDTVCIRGGMPVSTLIQGSVDDVREQCKRVIDVVGDGGGFIMDAGVGIPDEAKPENVQAMFEATREYGIYR